MRGDLDVKQIVCQFATQLAVLDPSAQDQQASTLLDREMIRLRTLERFIVRSVNGLVV
jgi:hypothetical protein